MTPIAERLLALVRSMPPGALVPAAWVAEQLDAEPVTPSADAAGVDFTVAEIAQKFKRGESTIRTWLIRGDFEGAYRNQGLEWRIPPSGLAAYQAAQRARFGQQQRPGTGSAPKRQQPLGAWRDHMPRDGKSAA